MTNTWNITLPKPLKTIAFGLVVAGCTTAPEVDIDGAYVELPEPLVGLAAPYQNLQKVRLNPDDNCFWYLHDGPVEATWLPLRTAAGNPICQASED
ncbi:hypothetical protein [Pseudaestuariivita atlantica]|uniref:Uncharacterized protein n=1 Tax=Pseudaestuariivita atlantica TaxID=1317121 RepID=A0A0L1JUG5_9RHOB|nr:hypothetical protein [Pseudaestuariivita atlantica]KNG95406.1 hypothetical protein ATO11_02025 [Pseudaestuariivita atlantica]